MQILVGSLSGNSLHACIKIINENTAYTTKFMKKHIIILPILIVIFNCCKKEIRNDIEDNNIQVVQNKDSITDRDGNVYHTVTIGSQTWMSEDLKTTRYRNGNPITQVSVHDSVQWKSLTKGAYCENTNGSIFNQNPVGLLYNWYVVSDTLQICPHGWHVPTNNEWDTLCSVLSKSTGDEIKKIFKPEGCAQRLEDGHIIVTPLNILWWSSTDGFSGKAYYCEFNSFRLHRDSWGKKMGLNIRCIKDK